MSRYDKRGNHPPRCPQLTKDAHKDGAMTAEARTGFVYILICLANGKAYVGQTVRRPDVRWAGHIRCAFKHKDNRPLYRAMRKYGLKNFVADVIWCGLESKLNAAEIHYVRLFKTFIDTGWGYNLTTGGGVCKDSAATRKRKSIAIRKYFEEHPEECVAISRRQKKFYAKPAERLRLSEMKLEDWKLPDARKRHACTPKMEKVRVAKITATLRTPSSKKRQSKAQIAAWKVAGRRERNSRAMKAAHAAHPEIRKAAAASVRGTHPHTKAGKKALSKIVTAQWASEEGRQKKLEGLRRGAQRRWARVRAERLALLNAASKEALQ
jgi:group I intron endonuclease